MKTILMAAAGRPNREKNGWTGDAQLALETGLWNFEAEKVLHSRRRRGCQMSASGAIIST